MVRTVRFSCGFCSQRWHEIRRGIRTGALNYSFLLRVNTKGEFFRVEKRKARKSESVFSTKISFVKFCAEIDTATIFTKAKWLLTSCVFVHHGEILHCENDNSTNKSKLIVIRDDPLKRKRHGNFADYFCCIHIFSAKLLKGHCHAIWPL